MLISSKCSRCYFDIMHLLTEAVYQSMNAEEWRKYKIGRMECHRSTKLR